MARWGMAIDLRKCNGCQTCTVACKIENFTPKGLLWGQVYDYETGQYPTVQRRFLPALCMHCESPPCRDVCPTGATKKREDGIVYVDYQRCTGCQACALACPYEARFLYTERDGYFDRRRTPYEQFPYEWRAPSQRFTNGTMTKCTFCMHRIDQHPNKRPGIDPEATPACVVACITGARIFGDLDDSESEINKVIRERRGFTLLPELGTGPSVYYLP